MLTVALYAFLGLLFMGIARPLINRRVGPNYFYGFRTPRTLSSPDIWYPANEYFGRKLFATGVLIVLSAVLFSPLTMFGGRGVAVYTFILVGIMLASLFGVVIASFRYLKRL